MDHDYLYVLDYDYVANGDKLGNIAKVSNCFFNLLLFFLYCDFIHIFFYSIPICSVSGISEDVDKDPMGNSTSGSWATIRGLRIFAQNRHCAQLQRSRNRDVFEKGQP